VRKSRPSSSLRRRGCGRGPGGVLVLRVDGKFELKLVGISGRAVECAPQPTEPSSDTMLATVSRVNIPWGFPQTRGAHVCQSGWLSVRLAETGCLFNRFAVTHVIHDSIPSQAMTLNRTSSVNICQQVPTRKKIRGYQSVSCLSARPPPPTLPLGHIGASLYARADVVDCCRLVGWLVSNKMESLVDSNCHTNSKL
jgi:hypothetical protein